MALLEIKQPDNENTGYGKEENDESADSSSFAHDRNVTAGS